MTGVVERSESRLDVVPAALVLERTAYRLGDEGAATPTSDPVIELRDELIIQAYV
jgi:hypothetical protein